MKEYYFNVRGAITTKEYFGNFNTKTLKGIAIPFMSS